MGSQNKVAYGLAAGIALAAALLIVWMSVAAGLLGIEDDDPANLLYVGVLGIGGVGALAARFRARGLRIALLVTALAQALVAVSGMAVALAPRLVELDINPVFVRPAGQGVAAADALIVLK